MALELGFPGQALLLQQLAGLRDVVPNAWASNTTTAITARDLRLFSNTFIIHTSKKRKENNNLYTLLLHVHIITTTFKVLSTNAVLYSYIHMFIYFHMQYYVHPILYSETHLEHPGTMWSSFPHSKPHSNREFKDGLRNFG